MVLENTTISYKGAHIGECELHNILAEVRSERRGNILTEPNILTVLLNKIK